ncbi:hypothetical protein GGR51DRAFT_556563 [Nemania sp. FL0031]|nr:hypothetical protein GGR51DRAFT_556563 [Nemania sp. FL0031]
MFSREGFTVDVVARFMQRTILNPVIPISTATARILAYSRPSLSADIASPRLPTLNLSWIIATSLWALLSILIWVTDYLNDGYANNWINDILWDWNKEIVLITGGSSGIGASITQHLLKNNPNTTMVILDYSPLNWAPALGSRVHYYQCDLSQSPVIKNICDKVRREVGNPTVIVNNAGLSRGFTVMEGTYADVGVTIRTNLVAPFLLIKEFLPCMVQQNHGHILNISSMSSIIPLAGIADYAATKAGLNVLHEVNLSTPLLNDTEIFDVFI